MEIKEAVFSLQTHLSEELYLDRLELFKKDKTKLLSFKQNNQIICKIDSSILEDETIDLFQCNNLLEIPESMNLDLIKMMIHYLYLKEIKSIPFHSIFDFLDISIFLRISDLPLKICNYLLKKISNIDDAEFIRKKSLEYRFGRCPFSESILKIYEEATLFLLKNNHLNEFLNFFDEEYFKFIDGKDLDDEINFYLYLMKEQNIDGDHKLRLISIFKQCLESSLKERNANFLPAIYFKTLMETYLPDLQDKDPKSLNKYLDDYNLNYKDFQIGFLKKTIEKLEKKITEMEIADMKKIGQNKIKINELEKKIDAIELELATMVNKLRLSELESNAKLGYYLLK